MLRCSTVAHARRGGQVAKPQRGPAPYGGEGTSLLRPGRDSPPSPPPELAFLDDALGPLSLADDLAEDLAEEGEKRGRGRGARKGAQHAAFAAHSARLRALMTQEFEEELASTETRLRSWPASRLAQEGLALFGLAPSQEPDLQSMTVFRFQAAGARRAAGGGVRELPPLPEHRLGVGDMVSASPGRAAPEAGALAGVVLERGPAWLKVAFGAEAAEQQLGRGCAWRLDLTANAVSHERALTALQRFESVGGMPHGALAPPAEGRAAREAAAARRLQFSPLQLALLGGAGAAEAAAAPPPWHPAGREGRRAAAAAVAAHCAGLNDSQRRAVESALGRTLSLWQGPPGTGKTQTLLSFICAAVSLQPRAGLGGAAVLACAPSNLAADALLEGLLGSGLRAVRLGAPARIAPHLRARSLAALAAEQPGAARALALRAEARARGREDGAAAQRLRAAAREAEAAAAAAVLDAAHVVVATCAGAGEEPLLASRAWPWAVLDEAGQATEGASLVPLVRAAAALLVGDPRQLPPTVLSLPAQARAQCHDIMHVLTLARQRAGLGVSLAERLAAAAVAPLLLLDTQYRMHPALAAWCSRRFYGGRLRSGVGAAERAAPPLAALRHGDFDWPSSAAPLAFIDVAHGAEVRQGGDGEELGSEADGGGTSEGGGGGGSAARSLGNPAEAELAAELVAQLLRDGAAGGGGGARLRAADVAVLTPYSLQARLLTRALRARLGAARAAEVEVRTVDGFQGREREVVLFSAVRCNAGRRLGFTADARRLNVALTRAKRGLIVLGCRRTLSADENWASWLRHADAAGASLTAATLAGPKPAVQ